MIKVKHPLEKYNGSQAVFLATCPADQRRFHELLFAYGNSAYIYHQGAKDFEPDQKDFEEWLEGLPENIRIRMRKAGFKDCKTMLPFTRYVMEKNDVGIEAFIKQMMGEPDYAEYQSLLIKG